MVHLSIDASDEDVDIIFQKLDKGGKGNITYAEFAGGLRGSLLKQHNYTSAVEMEEHPLDANFGKKLAAMAAPPSYRRDWDSLISRATVAGNEIFHKGAASVQIGDR